MILKFVVLFTASASNLLLYISAEVTKSLKLIILNFGFISFIDCVTVIYITTGPLTVM